MKIIDLLNKIANGEEVPNIRHCDRLLKYNEEENWFEEIDGYTNYCKNYFLLNELNDETEIMEEDKKIEKMKYYDYLDKSKIIDKINEIIEVISKWQR